MPELQHRLARREDLPALRALMDIAIGELQKPFPGPAQIAASRAIMGLDTQLVDDGTYVLVEQDGVLAGCGGWSRRETLYGHDHTGGPARPGTRRGAGARNVYAPRFHAPRRWSTHSGRVRGGGPR